MSQTKKKSQQLEEEADDLEMQAEMLSDQAEVLYARALELRKMAKEEKAKEDSIEEMKKSTKKDTTKKEEEEDLRKAVEELEKAQKMEETDRKKAEEAIRKKEEESRKKTPSKSDLDECEEKLQKIQEIITGKKVSKPASRASSRAPSRASSRAPSRASSRAPSRAPSRASSRAPSPKEEKIKADLLAVLSNAGKTETSRKKAEEAVQKQKKELTPEEQAKREAFIAKRMAADIAKGKKTKLSVQKGKSELEKRIEKEQKEEEQKTKKKLKQADAFNAKWYPQNKDAVKVKQEKYKKMNVEDKIKDINRFIQEYRELYEETNMGVPLYEIEDLFQIAPFELEDSGQFDVDENIQKVWFKGEKKKTPKKELKTKIVESDFNPLIYFRELSKFGPNPSKQEINQAMQNAKKKTKIEPEKAIAIESTPRRARTPKPRSTPTPTPSTSIKSNTGAIPKKKKTTKTEEELRLARMKKLKKEIDKSMKGFDKDQAKMKKKVEKEEEKRKKAIEAKRQKRFDRFAKTDFYASFYPKSRKKVKAMDSAFNEMNKEHQAAFIRGFVRKYTAHFKTPKVPIQDILNLVNYNAKKLEEAGFKVDHSDNTFSL